jgi:hypothetical protein
MYTLISHTIASAILFCISFIKTGKCLDVSSGNRQPGHDQFKTEEQPILESILSVNSLNEDQLIQGDLLKRRNLKKIRLIYLILHQ